MITTARCTLRTPAAEASTGSRRAPTHQEPPVRPRTPVDQVRAQAHCPPCTVTVGLFALRGRVLAAAHRDEYPLTPDEAAAIAESAETWCRRWSAWQSDSIADVARHIAARLSGSAPTFVLRGRTVLRRHGQLWALHVQQGPGLTLSESVVEGQHYLVVNCDEHPLVRRIWVLWHAQRGDFICASVGSPLRRFVFAQPVERESRRRRPAAGALQAGAGVHGAGVGGRGADRGAHLPGLRTTGGGRRASRTGDHGRRVPRLRPSVVVRPRGWKVRCVMDGHGRDEPFFAEQRHCTRSRHRP